jgi:hypothetical protein
MNMSHEDTPAGEGFEQRLSRLRTRIDLLPPEQRPHLYELAETIAGQHRKLHDRKPPNHATE